MLESLFVKDGKFEETPSLEILNVSTAFQSKIYVLHI